MNIELVKVATAIVVGTGIESVISNAIKDTTPDDTKVVSKVFTWIGLVVLTGMLGEKACEYTDKKIDELTEFINDNMVKDQQNN